MAREVKMLAQEAPCLGHGSLVLSLTRGRRGVSRAEGTRTKQETGFTAMETKPRKRPLTTRLMEAALESPHKCKITFRHLKEHCVEGGGPGSVSSR